MCYVAARDIDPAYAMTRQLFVYCLGFALGSALCPVQYILIRLGRFPRNPYIGIALRVTRDSDEVWWRVHRAAAPWIGWAGLLAAFGALLAGSGHVSPSTPRPRTPSRLPARSSGMRGLPSIGWVSGSVTAICSDPDRAETKAADAV